MLRCRLPVWLRYATLVLPLFTGSVQGADEPFAPDQERILQIKVGNYQLDEPLLCYQVGDTLMVPLGQLAQSIDLAVKTSPASGHAEGFIFRQEKTFLLDVGQRLVVVDGMSQPLNPERVRVTFDDIYVDASLAQNWFGFSLEPHLLNSQLVIRSKTPLPFEERLKREELAAKLSARPISQIPAYPRRDEPYHFFETPFIDQTLRAGVARNVEGDRYTTHSYSTFGSGDLLWMDSSWYVAGSQDGSQNASRLTLSRKDPDGRVLGALTELSLVHVQEPRVSLINLPGLTQPGILFGNTPLYQSSTFDTHTFVGDLQPGWQVELYQNEVLLGFQRPNSEGQYRFADIPLIYGHNYFRLVFYGPQGQRLEETQQFEVGQSQVPAGKQYYRVMSTEDRLGGSRTIIDYNAGLYSNLSFSGNLVSLPLSEANGTIRQHDYVRAGVNTSLNRAVVSLAMIDDMQSGSAVDTRIQGRVDNSVIGLIHTRFKDFVSEQFTTSQLGIVSQTQLRLDSSIPSSSYTPVLPLSLEVGRDEYRDNVVNQRANFRLSMSGHGFSASNQLNWNKFGSNTALTTGILQAAFHFNNVTVRSDYQYELFPSAGTTAIALSGDITNFHRYNLNAGVTRSMVGDTTYVTAGASRDFGNFLGLVSMRHGSQGDYLIELGVTFSLGRNPRNGNWTMRSYGMARYGAVAPRAFLDENGNGIQDANEQPLSDVGFQFNGMRRPQHTDEQGDALVTNAFPYMPLGVGIDSSTLGDPAYTPEIEGVTLVNRPGHVAQVDFPIKMTGEVDGVVTLKKEGRSINVGGVELQLIGPDGQVIQRARTSYDGFYLFSKVPAGAYEVRIDPEQTRRLGLADPEPRAAAIHGPSWFEGGIDFQLEMEKPAAE